MTVQSSRPRLTNKRPAAGCLVYGLFGIFLLVGSGCLVSAAVKLVKTVRFVAVSSITTGTVVDHQARRGSKSATYAPVVTYAVPGGGEVRFVSAVSSSMSDYAVGQTVPVRFDPSDTSVAEINEFIPLWFPFIIMAVLGSIFVALPGGQLLLLRRGQERERLKEEGLARGLPEWQADPQWRGGRVRGTLKQEMYFFIWFALIWNGIAVPTGFMALREFFLKGNRPALVGLLFPIAGGFIAWQAFRRHLLRRRYGDPELQLDPFPPVAGGEAAGRLHLGPAVGPAQPLRVALLCRAVADASRRGGSGHVLRSLEGEAAVEPGGMVRFRIPLPADLEPAGPDREWLIRFSSPAGGGGLNADFVIPLAPAGTPVSALPGSEPSRQSVPEPAVTAGTMTCPKCGCLQAVAEACGACGLIIARYRSRSNRATAARPALSSPAIAVVALILLAVLGGGGYFGWQLLSGGNNEAFDAASGAYSNRRYGLSLSLPPGWKRYSVKEAIGCSTLRDAFADQYLLLASPTRPSECLLVVNISGLSLDYFRRTGWDGIVDDYRSRNKVRFTEVASVGGFQLHRLGYEVAGVYREDAMFETADKLMEIYFYIPDGADAASRAEELRDFINSSLRRL